MPGWPDFAGTLPGWITATGITTLVGVVLHFILGRRKLGIDEKKIDNENEADIRDHFAEEISGLRASLESSSHRHLERERLTDHRHRRALASVENRYRRLLTESDEKHDHCQQELSVQRDQVQALKEQQSGLVRLILQNSASGVLRLDDSGVSDFVREAAERVELVFKPRPDEGGDEGRKA